MNIADAEEAEVTLSQSIEQEEIQDDSPAEASAADSQGENGSDIITKVDEKLDENADVEGNSTIQIMRSVIGGDFLSGNFIRGQLGLIVLIAICCLSHIALRYICQKDLVEIDRLKKELDDAKFNQLTRFSELTAKTRQSYVEEILRQNHDSTLQTSTNPPYIIHIKDKDKNNFTDTDDPKVKGLVLDKEIVEE